MIAQMIDVELIRKLVDIVSHSDIDELKVGDKDIRVTIKKSTLEKGHIVYETKKETEEALKSAILEYKQQIMRNRRRRGSSSPLL